MQNRVRLTLMGLSYNPLQDGAFAMLLAAEGTQKRIPIIIGASEAQAIAIVVENIKPQRPMTHDLFATMAHAFGIELREVFIYSFEDGIFSSEMTFSDGERTVALDSRTSDAVAVALRTGAPIYTTPEILEQAGIEFREVESDEGETDTDLETAADGSFADDADGDTVPYEAMTDDELTEAFENAISSDNFEEAAVIRRILDRRKGSNS